MSHFIDIDPDRRNLVNKIFYEYSCYDSLEFEISCIHKVRDFLKELFISEIRQSKFPETEVIQRMHRFLHLMLIAKYCQFAETLGATAIAYLNTKIRGSNLARSKSNEQKIVLKTLAGYNVGEVVNFYSTVSNRDTPYIADLMGYPPPSMQGKEQREVLEEDCIIVRELLHSVGYYYRLFVNVYNSNKHGYRTIPTTINDTDEGILIVKKNGEPALLQLDLKEIDKMFELSSRCRVLLQNIIENHKLAIRISYENEKNINLRLHRRKENTSKPIQLKLIYRPREDLIKEIKAAEKEILKKIGDLERYRGNCILLDLDQEKILFSDRDRQKVIEYYLNHDEPDNEHRTTITRLTEEYLSDLK